MKQNNRTTIKKIFGYITLAMALTACGSDDEILNDVQRGDRHPLQFTATVEDIQTRVTSDNKWTDGDIIGVKISNDPNNTIGQYKLNADGTVKEVIKGVEWQGNESATVTAWYPYAKDLNMIDISEQQNGYTDFDILRAEAQGSSAAPVNLVFNHLMAKVRCRLVTADGTGTGISGAKVKFNSVILIAVKNGKVHKEGPSVEITPYEDSENGVSTYTAMLPPQNITAGTQFINITIGDKTVYYIPAQEINLEAGKSYNYQIKLNVPDKIIDDDGTYHVYTAEGLNEWAKAVENDLTTSCTLEADITMPVPETAGGNNWTPISKFEGTFDGNGHTITGLVVNSTDYDIGFIENNKGMVKNLTLKATNISGKDNVGAVVGSNSGAIENCHVTGASVITGDNTCVGGVVGINFATISACHVTEGSVITGSNTIYIGGVVGYNDGKISACHVANDCSVNGHVDVGGITGLNKSTGVITGCYALCSLKGNNSIGGISGDSDKGSYTACYSKCSYSSGINIGGIVGYIASEGTPTFTACYWQGNENCDKGVGDGDGTTGEVGGTDGNTWAYAAGVMNEALEAAGFGYLYEVNDDSSTEPLVLRKKP